MGIEYKTNVPLTTDQFIDLLRESGLGERRPIDDRQCMEGMVNNSNLMVTAWDSDKLIGIARSMTDFHYACYQLLRHIKIVALAKNCKTLRKRSWDQSAS